MVEDSLQFRAEPLKLIHPVCQGREGGHNHEGAIDMLLVQMREEGYGLDLQQQAEVMAEI